MVISRLLSKRLHIAILPALIALTSCDQIIETIDETERRIRERDQKIEEEDRQVEEMDRLSREQQSLMDYDQGYQAGEEAAGNGLKYDDEPGDDFISGDVDAYQRGYREGYEAAIVRAQQLEEQVRRAETESPLVFDDE